VFLLVQQSPVGDLRALPLCQLGAVGWYEHPGGDLVESFPLEGGDCRWTAVVSQVMSVVSMVRALAACPHGQQQTVQLVAVGPAS
jgi:hypothetical protein